jgi:EEF1A N-terminal glycine/lysine methyltransferase
MNYRTTVNAVLELGAGCALPSLLLSTLSPPSKTPKMIVITDYPDETILRNLKGNVERNAHLIQAVECEVTWKGYEWGTDPEEVL